MPKKRPRRLLDPREPGSGRRRQPPRLLAADRIGQRFLREFFHCLGAAAGAQMAQRMMRHAIIRAGPARQVAKFGAAAVARPVIQDVAAAESRRAAVRQVLGAGLSSHALFPLAKRARAIYYLTQQCQ